MAEIGLACVGKLTELIIDPILCQFKYMFCYKSKIETLKDKVNGVNGLKTKERELQQLVGKAKRNAETIKPGVTDLLDKADKLKEQAERILESETNFEMQCLFLTCPNLKTRYSLGRKAAKKTTEVVELLKEFTYERVGEPKPVEQTPDQNPGDFVAFETRISIKKEIMEALKDKDVKIIGICGMPGVGKTTMANEIAKEVKVEKLFDDVAIAVVSKVEFQDQGEIEIQDKLAEALGLEIKEMRNVLLRRGRLRDRLGGDAKRSVLIILDDVWECIELGNIGIPLSDDDKRLKVLLTSRFEGVCNDMGAQKKFKVDVLNSEESWKLFKEKAKISDNAIDDIKCTAKKVAMECGGLPLALVTVGRALSTKTEDAWKNALLELQNSSVTNIRGVQKLLYSRIELSYNYLESNEAKSLLLLCSLFPEDYSIAIEHLVKYAWGLKLFRGTETLITTRHRVNSIVDILKSCYMLLLAKNEEDVKLHDVVRDVCLQIASKENLSKQGLKEWPKHDNNEPYGKILLSLHEQMNQLPSGLDYPNLKFLSVWCNFQSLNIPKEFFANMKDLRVLDFTAMKIQISSIPLLTNLRTLCLDYCTLKSNNSTIGHMEKLEVLSFHGSNLDHYPDDIAKLSNLRSLDLRSKHSCPLPRGILVKLKKLEELYMGIIEIRDDELEQRAYIVEEISSLTGLNTFQISTNDPQFLLQILRGLCIEKLERFHIELTDLEYARENIMEYYYFRRVLHICSITDASILSQHVINSLMWRTDYLSTVTRRADHLSLQVLEKMNMADEDDFEYLNGNHPTKAFYRLKVIDQGGMPRQQEIDLHSLSNFKRFRFASKNEDAFLGLMQLAKMKSDVSILFEFEYAKDDAEISKFSQLTSLDMISLPKLVHMTRMFSEENYVFENLTKLRVSGCENLSYLFSPSIARSLLALKYLWVYHCKALEEIIGRQEDNTTNTEIVEKGSTRMIVFPKLRDLSLFYLDRFRLLSSQNYEFGFPSLKSLQIIKCLAMTKFCSRLSVPMLDKVCINSRQPVDISKFKDSEGWIHIGEDGKFVDTSNIVEDSAMSN